MRLFNLIAERSLRDFVHGSFAVILFNDVKEIRKIRFYYQNKGTNSESYDSITTQLSGTNNIELEVENLSLQHFVIRGKRGMTRPSIE